MESKRSFYYSYYSEAISAGIHTAHFRLPSPRVSRDVCEVFKHQVSVAQRIKEPALKNVTLCFTLYPVTSSRAKTKQLTAPSPVAASDYVLGARAQTVSCIFKIEIPDVNTKLHNDTANTLNSVGGLRAALDSVYDSSGQSVPAHQKSCTGVHFLFFFVFCLLIRRNTVKNCL